MGDDIKLRVSKIEKSFPGVKALDKIDFTVRKGTVHALCGENGAGKTTLMNILSSILRPSLGSVAIGGQEITRLSENELSDFRRKEIGFIFQDFNLLDTLTAYENIALALQIQNFKAKAIEQQIKVVARKLDIEDILNKYPYEMSGGQKQRVASARAIVTNPKLVLADEPTGALDSKSSKMLLERLQRLNQDYQTTILMVTHDAFSASYASKVIFIKDGKVFNQFNRGEATRKQFFDKIIDVVSLLEGDVSDVI